MMAESRIRAISKNCLKPAMARHREVAENGIIFIRSNPVDHSPRRTADRMNAMKLREELFEKAMSLEAVNPVAFR